MDLEPWHRKCLAHLRHHSPLEGNRPHDDVLGELIEAGLVRRTCIGLPAYWITRAGLIELGVTVQ